jgi:hypothetical protein
MKSAYRDAPFKSHEPSSPPTFELRQLLATQLATDLDVPPTARHPARHRPSSSANSSNRARHRPSSSANFSPPSSPPTSKSRQLLATQLATDLEVPPTARHPARHRPRAPPTPQIELATDFELRQLLKSSSPPTSSLANFSKQALDLVSDSVVTSQG